MPDGNAPGALLLKSGRARPARVVIGPRRRKNGASRRLARSPPGSISLVPAAVTAAAVAEIGRRMPPTDVALSPRTAARRRYIRSSRFLATASESCRDRRYFV